MPLRVQEQLLVCASEQLLLQSNLSSKDTTLCKPFCSRMKT
jgi:hypothetical protein